MFTVNACTANNKCSDLKQCGHMRLAAIICTSHGFHNFYERCMPEKKPATKQAGKTRIAASYIMINVYSNMVF